MNCGRPAEVFPLTAGCSIAGSSDAERGSTNPVPESRIRENSPHISVLIIGPTLLIVQASLGPIPLHVAKMTQAADIAIVSFDRFINGDGTDKKAVAKEVYDAFSSVGWVYISDHGIPQTRVDEVFGLVCAPLIR